MAKIGKKENFPKKSGWDQLIPPNELLTSCKISKKINFEQYTKKLIFGPKINKNSENRQNENFPKNGV